MESIIFSYYLLFPPHPTTPTLQPVDHNASGKINSAGWWWLLLRDDYYYQGVGTRWSFRSLPTLTILWLRLDWESPRHGWNSCDKANGERYTLPFASML